MENQQNIGAEKLVIWMRGIVYLLLLIIGISLVPGISKQDFWYDEVLSLEEFILVPLSKTVTDYQVPNNHIFFSILMNLWLKLCGINTFTEAANTILVVRLLPLLIALITLLTVKKIEKKITTNSGGVLSIVFLVSIIPFLNTVAQVRGYGLSMLLSTVVFYFGYLFYENPSKGKGAFVALFTALLLYTIPSNLYAVLSALVVLGSIFLYQCYKYHFLIALRFNAIKLIGWLILGVGGGVLLYLPVGDQVINNEYVQSEGLFRWKIWDEAVQIFRYMFMPFYIIPVLIIVGLWVAYRKKVDLRLIAALAAIVILPFVFSFIRGGTPFDRTFLWVCPFIAIIGVVSWDNLSRNNFFKGVLNHEPYLKMLVAITVIFSTAYAWGVTKNTLKYGLEKGTKYQNIYYNYYQSNFSPHKNLGLLKEEYYQEGTQVFLHEVDKRVMPAYLSIHNLKWQPFKDTIPYLSKYYIITAFENKAIDEYRQYDTTFEFKRINKELDFVNIIEAKRRQ